MMFVVEDITEFERLEKEVEEQKEKLFKKYSKAPRTGKKK